MPIIKYNSEEKENQVKRRYCKLLHNCRNLDSQQDWVWELQEVTTDGEQTCAGAVSRMEIEKFEKRSSITIFNINYMSMKLLINIQK